MRNTTKLIIFGVIVALIGWDVAAYLFGKNATISVVLTDWAYYTPWVSFVAGCLAGHWFWPARGSND
jgi:hypothetical protein